MLLQGPKCSHAQSCSHAAGSYLVKAGLALPFHWLGGDMAMEIGGAVMQFLYGPAMTIKLYAARVMRSGSAASEGQQGTSSKQSRPLPIWCACCIKTRAQITRFCCSRRRQVHLGHLPRVQGSDWTPRKEGWASDVQHRKEARGSSIWMALPK